MLINLEEKIDKTVGRGTRLETAKVRPLILSFYRKHRYLESGSSFYGNVEAIQFMKELLEAP